MYENDRSKVKLRKARINAKKSDAICMGLERNRLLRAAAAWLILTIDSNLYCQQFERLCQAERKRPELIIKKGIFRHDRQRQTPSLTTRQNSRKLGWEVLMHPPYRSLHYYLFRSLEFF